jgi:uncharacterized protein YbjT (DUF2867 family)
MVNAANSIPKFLITGATGNVGTAVINQLMGEPIHITAGVRNLEKARRQLGQRVDRYYHLDFATQAGLALDETYTAILLIRPPQLGDAKRYFEPFIAAIPKATKVVFLSVQGADKKGYLPHAKIEELIRHYQLDHVFLRPSYFMENLVTTLYDELHKRQQIFLPAGHLKLNWVAVADVARVAKQALLGQVQQPAVEITSDQVWDFGTVVDLINAECQTRLRYESPSLLRYVVVCVWRGYDPGYLLVMLLLHYLPRFAEPPQPTNTVKSLTGQPPKSLRQFVQEHCDDFANADA